MFEEAKGGVRYYLDHLGQGHSQGGQGHKVTITRICAMYECECFFVLMIQLYKVRKYFK